jgi:hypothetical protein
MKIILRSLVFIAFLGFAIQAKSQCTVTNVIIQNIDIVSSDGTCSVTFDASFNIQNNSGNKYIFIHAWLLSDYPNYFQCVNNQTTQNGAIQAPDATDLAEAFLNIGINNNGETPVILTTYPPDASVQLTTVASITKTVLPDGSANFVLTGISITVPSPCGTPNVIIADLWSSQSANAQVAHCVYCGISYSSDFLNAIGLVNCTTLTYSATVTNNTNMAITGTYSIYADIDNDGIFTPASDTLLSGPLPFSIGAGVGMTTNVSGSIPGANLNQSVFAVFTPTTPLGPGPSDVVLLPSTQCAGLPVTLRSFTARRVNANNVQLKWETATELNNKGFILQRNTTGNKWEDVAFIRSQSEDGNSASVLYYSFSDINAIRTITQYRIQQVDIDGKNRFSEIRTVRGEGQGQGIMVYPNPSRDGRVNIVFEDKEGVRDAMLSDMNGRVMNRWTITNGNTIQVNNLQPGVYYVRITNAQTRETAVEKIVVIGLK